MTVVLTINDSGTPKRNLIEMAFEECGSAGYEFERTAEEIASAHRKLDTMMKEWPWNLLGYVSGGQASDLSGVPEKYEQAVALSLALRIASTGGFTLSPEARAALAQSRALLMSETATVPTALIARNTQRGAGGRGSPFIYDTED